MANSNDELGNPTKATDKDGKSDAYENEDAFGGGPRGYDANEERYDRDVNKDNPQEKDRLKWGEENRDKSDPTGPTTQK